MINNVVIKLLSNRQLNRITFARQNLLRCAPHLTFPTDPTLLDDWFEPLKSELTIYQSADGKELPDLRNLPLIDEGYDILLRFSPEYDDSSVKLTHHNRSIADADRSNVFRSAAQVIRTIVIESFVGAMWKASHNNKTAVLSISPFLFLK